jgi:hypothetical protein
VPCAELTESGGRIRVKTEVEGRVREAWILVQAGKDGLSARVHIGLGAYDAEPGLPKAHELLAGVAKRVGG